MNESQMKKRPVYWKNNAVFGSGKDENERCRIDEQGHAFWKYAPGVNEVPMDHYSEDFEGSKTGPEITKEEYDAF